MADVLGSFERGFSLGDRILNVSRQREQQKADDEWRAKGRAQQEKQWGLADEDRARRLKREESDLAWQEKSRAEQEKRWGRQADLSAAQTEAAKASKAASQYALGRKKQADYFKDNMPLIQNDLEKWKQTGEMSDVFDNPNVKGTPYDPRSWTSDKYLAGSTIERLVPDVISGKLQPSDPQFLDAYGEFYKDNVKASVGTVDEATGKTIRDAKLANINFVADIDPNTPGNQNGLILSTEVTYDDGSKAVKPITNDRSTSPGDNPRVIPIEAAMQDLTTQLGMMREAIDSPHFDALTQSQHKDKSKTELTKEYFKTLDGLEKERAKALANAMDENDSKRINSQFNEVVDRIKRRYTPLITDKPESKRSTTTDPKGFSENMKTLRTISSGYDVPTESMAEIRDAFKSGKITFEQAQEFITTQFNPKSGKAGDNGGKGDDSLLASFREGARGLETSPEAERPVQAPAEDLAKYEALSDDELMKMTTDGDTVAMRVLRARNIARNEGEYVGLPGRTTQEEKAAGQYRLAEYNRLMAEGKTEEANAVLASAQQDNSLSLAGR